MTDTPPLPDATEEEDLKGPISNSPEKIEKLATEALSTLAGIMRQGTSEAARIAACNALLDRARGKPRSGGAGEAEGPIPTRVTVRFV